ncbi:RsmF rRNA methyltransferase first C-terminal domain-containing protein [Caloranaerobacter ferrireducens]|uniref:RsmF rRNA methyltransferase first C-terminal domain-containing protein n=1 Tax=Caloranaerobacter ferrireducens TaxID=1323370 RepID=UPI00084DC7A5|nr:RsmF rRNA methyltransferase first C-terminal domain-containing protein [Caloranaerobacter ferrireducens]
MNLPEEFLIKMQGLLGNEYNDFIESYDKESYKGIRVNTLKLSVEDFKKISPFDLREIPWCREGFYIDDFDRVRPGKHPYYHCGLYYIQEPSAMIPVEVLDPKPGDRVLDISAAPGGKATQIGAKLNGKGLLVANDISPKRVRALTKNIEMFGIRNSIVTNETPERLAEKFKYFFDKILVDAPCSGEGMFRKDPKSVKSWSKFSVKQCSEIQKDILKYIPRMLKPGGMLVYSTCTFSPEENEGTIEWFLREFPEFEVVEIKNINVLDRGRPEWIDGRVEIQETLRAWPHKIKGEGHFIALLRKKDGQIEELNRFNKKCLNYDVYLEFEDLNMEISLKESLHSIGENLYSIPDELPDLTGIKVANLGLYLGKIKKNRFEPSQSLALAFKKEYFRNVIDFSSESIEVIKYLKGETLMLSDKKGWKLVCIDGFPAGWGKQTDSFLKNYYRPEWRMK